MKNNTSRLHRNAATTGRKNQLPTVKKPKPERTITVAFFAPEVRFEAEAGATKTIVEFPESVWNRVEQARKKLGLTHEQFFNQAMREKLTRAGIELPPPSLLQARGDLRELAESVDATSELLLILGEKSASHRAMALARQSVDKLNDDLSTLAAAFNLQSNPPASEVAS